MIFDVKNIGVASTLLTGEKKHQKFLSWRKAEGCTLNLKINLDRLFKKAKERE